MFLWQTFESYFFYIAKFIFSSSWTESAHSQLFMSNVEEKSFIFSSLFKECISKALRECYICALIQENYLQHSCLSSKRNHVHFSIFLFIFWKTFVGIKFWCISGFIQNLWKCLKCFFGAEVIELRGKLRRRFDESKKNVPKFQNFWDFIYYDKTLHTVPHSLKMISRASDEKTKQLTNWKYGRKYGSWW